MSTPFGSRADGETPVGIGRNGQPITLTRNDVQLNYELTPGSLAVEWLECKDCHRNGDTDWVSFSAFAFLEHLLDHVTLWGDVIRQHHLEHVAAHAVREYEPAGG